MNIPIQGQQQIQNWYQTNIQSSEATTAAQIGYNMSDTISESDLVTWIYPPEQQYPSLPLPYLNFDAFAAIFFSHPEIELDFGGVQEDNGAPISNLSLFTQIAMDTAEAKHKIISNMLDSWIEQIHKQQEEIEEMVRSPEYQKWLERMDPTYENEVRRQYPDAFEIVVKSSAEFQQYIAAMNPQKREQELHRVADNESSLRVGLSNVVDNYVRNDDGGEKAAIVALPLLAGALTIGGYMAGNIAEKVSSSAMTEALQGLNQQVPPSLIDATTITVNLFATSMLYQSTAETLFQSAAKGKKPVDADMARNFASETISKIKGNEINGAMLAMLRDKMVGSEPVSHKQIGQLVDMAKIMMALNALILLYRAEAGGTTPEEIAAMIKGEISVSEGSEEAQLANLIQQHRANLPKDLQAGIFASMMTYTEHQSKLNDMLDPMRVIRNALNTEDFDAMVWGSTTA